MDETQKKFSDLYDSYINKIYRFAYLRVSSHEAAQDLAADTFARFWESFKLNPNGVQNPRAFLYTIAKNLVVDYYRDKGKTNVVNADISDLKIIDHKNDIAKTAEINSDIESVRKALTGLNDDYQNAVIWRYLDDLEIAEVASLLGRTETATRVLLHRAMKELKTRLN
jgi:RNA polymerase sigma-70 factor (ECF subfamily)